MNTKDAEKFDFYERVEQRKNKKSPKEREKDIKAILDKGITIESNPEFYYTKEKYPNYFKEDGVNLEKEINEKYQFYQCRRGLYVRKNMSNVCPTLTANMGTGGHNVPLILADDGIRKLTPAETFKLQGFPVGKGYKLPTEYKGKKYSNAHLYKQAGNAVSVDMITMIAKEILEILD